MSEIMIKRRDIEGSIYSIKNGWISDYNIEEDCRFPLLLLLLSHFSRVQLCVTPWIAAHQAPLSIKFSRQEYCSGLPFPPLGELPNPGIKPRSSTDSLPTEPPEKYFSMSYIFDPVCILYGANKPVSALYHKMAVSILSVKSLHHGWNLILKEAADFKNNP